MPFQEIYYVKNAILCVRKNIFIKKLDFKFFMQSVSISSSLFILCC